MSATEQAEREASEAQAAGEDLAEKPGEGDSTITAADRRLVTIAMMLAMSVAALEQLVVATAMPRIIASLGGGQHYAWVMSAYLMAATVSTPIYGKLADVFGRRRVLMFGLTVFLLGSALSGFSTSMTMLIAMRGLQGLGAGAVMPMVLTIIGDIFTLSERAKVQSYFSAVWGSASVLGPVLGGYLTDYHSWRWVFFVPLPFGAVALAVIALRYREVVRRSGGGRLDWPGAALLAAGSSTLLLTIFEGTGRPDSSTIGLVGLTILLLAAFVWWERRAEDPILPLDLFATPTILAAILGSFLIGALLFGLDAYIPLEFQGVLGRSATEAGGLMTPLFLAWSISVTVAAKLVIRRGFRASAIVGTLLLLAGLATISAGAAFPKYAAWLCPVGMVVVGFGMGPTSLSYILSVQNAVPWGRRGVATGAVTFFRTIGSALGVALLGVVLIADLGARTPGASDLTASIRAESLEKLGPERVAELRESLGLALRDLFALMFVGSAFGLLCAAGLPAKATDPAEEHSDDLPDHAAVAALE